MNEHEAPRQFVVPLNRIEADCDSIRPTMLTLVELNQRQIDGIVESVPGGAKNVQDIYPLTPLQEGMLIECLLNQRNDTYTFSTLFEFQSQVQVGLWTKALNKAIDRHDVMRTSIVWEKVPRPVQVVHRHVVLTVHELMLDREGDPIEQLKGRMKPGKQQVMDLRQAPLVQIFIAADQDGQKWYALLQLHHLISDLLSLKVLVAEVIACLEGREQDLPAPEDYRNYVAQELARIQTEEVEGESFFRSKLGEIDEASAPFGLLDVHGDSGRVDETSRMIDPALSQKIRIQARHAGVSVARVFHAAWGLVVARTSGRDDVVYGTVLSTVRQGGGKAQGILGLAVNTLPLRLQLQNLTAKDLLEHTHRELLELVNHRHSPLVLAQRCTGILGSAPLFTAFLNYRHSNHEVEWDSPAGVRVLARGEAPTNYPITMSVDERGEGFRLTAHADRRVDPDRIIGYLQTAVQSLVEALETAPQTPALALSILPESERCEILETFNATQAPYPREKLIHELFEEQVQLTPDASAVLHEGKSLTYAELNSKANQLARYLLNQGVGLDQLVGICVERSPEMVVGLLGIMKAGGAYLPLDPNYPTERLQHMLQDGTPHAVLTQRELMAVLPDTPAEVIALDEKLSEIAGYVDENISAAELGVTAQNLVYVIYTSGSTGRPKGTVMTHRSMVNLIEWHRTNFPGSEGKRVLQFAALSFDVAFQETFSTLCTGGTLVLVDEWIRRDPRALMEFLNSHSIERLFVPPLMLQSLAECAKTRSAVPGSLRDVITAGEQLCISPEVAAFFKRLDGSRLHNHYGPTETHVVTALTLTGNPDQWPTLPPIGRPIANTQIYVLDGQRQPVPIGVAGEIYIGGVGVAQGYLGRPELTAQRFINDPFSSQPGARLYRTGDLGRWRSDRALEYLGRNDDQVKIRGYRIELGEIGAQLARHAQVKEAAVIVREDVPGEKRLVAYVTRRGQSDPSVEELRAHLKAVLPEYMVPSAIVTVESLPLTPSGKLDRHALPAPELEAYANQQYEPPQGEVEEILAGIWQELLRVERVGRNDNFFELGGHSLLVVQMMERLRRVGLSAEARSVFECPTLMDLASALTREAIGQIVVPSNLIPPGCEAITPQMLPLVQLEPEHIERIVQTAPGGTSNIQDIYPLAPLQEGMLFHHLFDERGGDTYVVPMLLSLVSREKLNEFISAVQQVIDRHDILRTAVLWEQLPQPVQVVYRQTTLPVEEILLDRIRDPIEQLKERMKPEGQRLDLRKAPLMRLQIASDPHSAQWYALLQIHHLVCDNKSLDTMLAEVMTYLEGRGEWLPEPAAYRNHVAQVLAHANTHDSEAFFRSKLGDVDEPTAPFGLLDTHGEASGIENARQLLESTLAKRLRVQARHLGVSAATLFHMAWALVVSSTSGRDDVVFGSVLLGRLQGSAGAQRVLGMFINTLPLRLRLRGVTAKELVEQTQRELVELLNHEQASLAVAQRCSGIAGSAPLFSALLNYRHGAVDLECEFGSTAGMTVLETRHWTNYPVLLSVDEQGEDFALTVDTDRRIDPQRVTGYMQEALHSLVEALEKAPETPVLALSILPKSERCEIVEAFNATQAPYPQEKLIHELFEEQVRHTPDATAVVHEGKSLTYAELNSKANQLARYLRDKGVGPDQLVGICVDRSLEMVVGLLGILKAGGAYVPLDPNYPAERLSNMLRDATPSVVVTQKHLKNKLLSMAPVVAAIDSDWSSVAEWGDEDLDPHWLQLTSRHLAYVIYTSGSTGNPKGVMVEHAGVVNVLTSMRQKPGIIASDCMLAVTTMSFDIAALEIYLPLVSGAKLVLASVEVASDSRLLMATLDECDVTVLQATPSTWQLLLSGGWTGRPNLKAICGGEALPTELSGQLIRRVGALWNLYGPTETTIWSCRQQIGRIPDERTPFESIGQPISNTQIYILDWSRQVVPVGVLGELYIGGAGVARGYLNRPELTAERFIANPFSADPQTRLYRTGDLGRWRSDGTIEFQGRNDDQVKIWGYRIELGEIEAQLARHAQVKQAVVVAREDVPGEKRLVAYVIPQYPSGVEATPSVKALRDYLKTMLPEYMVPSAIVMLERFPLTPSGKLDRRALPAPELEAYAKRQYEPPQGEVEEILAGTWQELLRVERVGRNDNFFELGGHSLLATRLISRIRERLQVELSVRALFDAPTVEQLSVRVRSEGHGQTKQETLWMDNLSRDLRAEISEMPDDAVWARITELEKELGYREADSVSLRDRPGPSS